MANKRRAYRIAERIRELVATELLHSPDPRLSLVTVTSVVVSSDLRNAKIYWMVSGGEERIGEVEDALQNAKGHFRSQAAKDLGIKFAPDLRFYYDDTLDTVEEIDRLMEGIERKPE